MPLPNNNLPTGSQQWAREIEKQLAILNQASAIRSSNAFSIESVNQVNAANLSSLLLDQVELTSYSTELDSSAIQAVTFSSGVDNTFDSDTRDLDIIINLSKPRKLLISYSTFYKVEATTSSNPLGSGYGFDSTIFLNGEIVDYQQMLKVKQVTTLNDLIYDYDSIDMTKLISVPAGEYKISVTMQYRCTPAQSGSTTMQTSGDNLIVTVLQ